MDLFETFRSAKASAQKKLDGLREAMDAAMRKRDDLIAAPAPMGDIRAVIEERIATAAAAHVTAVQASLAPLFNTPNDLLKPSVFRRVSLTGAGKSLNDPVSVGDLDRVLAAMLPKELQRALYASIDAMKRPAEGLPLNERPAAVAQLSATIEALRTELATLRAKAQDAGVELD